MVDIKLTLKLSCSKILSTAEATSSSIKITSTEGYDLFWSSTKVGLDSKASLNILDHYFRLLVALHVEISSIKSLQLILYTVTAITNVNSNMIMDRDCIF